MRYEFLDSQLQSGFERRTLSRLCKKRKAFKFEQIRLLKEVSLPQTQILFQTFPRRFL